MKNQTTIEEFFHTDAQHEILHGDALRNLQDIESNKFDLIITSPPYNVGKEYEAKQSIEKYLETQEIIIEQIVVDNCFNLAFSLGDSCKRYPNDEGCKRTRKEFERRVEYLKEIRQPLSVNLELKRFSQDYDGHCQ